MNKDFRIKPEPPKLIVALDNCSVEQAQELVSELSEAHVRWFKVGLELYTQAGPQFIAQLKDQGLNVFLDLKLYDIPNTVGKAVSAAVRTGADLLTIHCSGGPAMLLAAQTAAEGSGLSLLGVTVLTSFGLQDFTAVAEAWGARQGQTVPRGAVALRLAEMASHAGLSGVVCSASDLYDGQFQKLDWKQKQPFFVTPGIRNSSSPTDDQKNVATAAQAVQAGATHLVVGRPITAPADKNRIRAAQEFLKEIKEVYGISSHS